MEIKYRFNENDDSYMKVDYEGLSIFMLDLDVPRDVYVEVSDIYLSVFKFMQNCKNKESLGREITIRADSALAKWLISNTDGKNIINIDEYISYDKIVNALLVATYQDNEKMANKLIPLFKERKSGTRDELGEYCSLQVIDYILKNSNFDRYLDSLGGNSKVDNECLYQNGTCQKVYISKK